MAKSFRKNNTFFSKFVQIDLFIQTLLTNFIVINGLQLECPLTQMHLEKIVGFRPPDDYLLTEQNLMYAARFSSIEEATTITALANTNHEKAVNHFYRMESEAEDETLMLTTSAICRLLCQKDEACIAYVHLLVADECYGYTFLPTKPENNNHYLRIEGGDVPLMADVTSIFYQKTCLKVPESCRNRWWTLTKIPGNSLVFQNRHTIENLVTRRECSERCLFESDFRCLSASFTPSYRNNRERFSMEDNGRVEQERTSTAKDHQNVLGRCRLNDKDKMTQPDAFKATPYDDEYIENHCHHRQTEDETCSYELYANSTFIYGEIKVIGLNQKECQRYCSQENRFHCQGVSFYYEDDLSRSECLLHSEDIISMGPRSLALKANSVYMRRVKCLDVQVICTRDEMIVRYSPQDSFQGKMYTKDHSDDCVTYGNGTGVTLLQLPVGSEIRENKCGLLRAYQVTSEYQRIFISALIILQNNPNVQTHGDRLIKVGCIMSDNSPEKFESESESKPEIITGGHINTVAHGSGASDLTGSSSEMDQEIDDFHPTANALESNTSFPKSVSFLGSDNASSLFPEGISFEIIDLNQDRNTNDVHIGQNLELRIVVEYSKEQLNEFRINNRSLTKLPDLRATNLTAKSMNDENFVQLIDEWGCPTDESIFPALEYERQETRNILKAKFHAFKFAGTSKLSFDVKLHFCHHENCTENNCVSENDENNEADIVENSIENINKRNRRELKESRKVRQRRQLTDTTIGEKFKVQNPVYISTVMDVNNVNDTRDKSNSNKSASSHFIPLNYNLNVHGPDSTNSKSLIYGERGVLLIAGIDDQLHTESICMNQSLLIAILIFWLIIQIALIFSCCLLIQKYKSSSMSEEDKRRIHENLDYIESNNRSTNWVDRAGYTL